MSIRRLKTLVAVAETGSFIEAARRVHITPAAVGQQMKSLETELGQPIFHRDAKVPRLNSLGMSLVPRARKLILDYQALMTGADAEDIAELTIGAVDTVMTGLVPATLRHLQESQRPIHLRIVPGLSSELLHQVDRGSLDAAVISEPRQRYPHLAWRQLAVEPLILITPPTVAGAAPEEILARYPFIRFSRNAWVGEQIDNWLLERGITVRETMELESLDAIYTMVSSDLGVSVVPDRCVPPMHTISHNRIPLGEDVVRVLGLLWRRDNLAYSAIDALAGEMAALAGKSHK